MTMMYYSSVAKAFTFYVDRTVEGPQKQVLRFIEQQQRKDC